MSVLFILTSLTSLVFLYFYIKAIRKIKMYLKEPNAKKGYFDYPLKLTNINGQYNITARLTIIELERYKNNKSKIKLENIDVEHIPNDVPKVKILKYIEDNFTSLMNTSDITWLELEENLSEIRRKKLEQLKKFWK